MASPLVRRSSYIGRYMALCHRQSISQTCRTMSLLIEDGKYSWLKELGLDSDNKGVFNGKWSGSGQVSRVP